MFHCPRCDKITFDKTSCALCGTSGESNPFFRASQTGEQSGAGAGEKPRPSNPFLVTREDLRHQQEEARSEKHEQKEIAKNFLRAEFNKSL